MKKGNYIKFCFIGALIVFMGSVLTLPSEAAPPILIGIVDDVTGFNADGGRAERDGAILCIEEWNAKGGINGRKIEYIFRDNAGDPTKATTIAKEFVNLGVVGVQGGTSTTVGLAEVAVFTPAQIPYMMVSMSAKLWDVKDSVGKSYAFSFVGSEPGFGEAYLNSLKYVPTHKRIATFYVNNIWGRGISDSIVRTSKEKAAYKGIEVVGTIECDLKATDLSKELVRIKALSPDVVLSIMYPDALVALFRGCQDLNYHPPNVTVWILAESVYLNSDKKLLYNVYGWSMYDGKKKVFMENLEKFKKRFGYTPVGHWTMAWDGMDVLLTAIKNVGTDRVAIRDWIATKSKGMPLISGNKKATCRIEEGSPYFYSSLYPQDYAVVYIDKNGKQVWKD
jgi:branched-chain amino acid transport system substrate-binding protein